MIVLKVVDTATGQLSATAKVKSGVVIWEPGVEQHNARPGLTRGDLRVVQQVDGEPTGEGDEVREIGAHWDGADAWIIDREYYDPAVTAAGVSAEAERRINEVGFPLSAATVSPGTVFRCDTASIARITSMANAPADIFPQTFVTRSGVTVTCATSADALAIKDEAARFVCRVLNESATLQANPPATTADLKDDATWPADGAEISS